MSHFLLSVALLASLLSAGCISRKNSSGELKPIELHARRVPGSADPAALREAIEQRAQELEADGVEPRTARALAAAEYSISIVGPVPRLPPKSDD
jgi:hypothetical protein